MPYRHRALEARLRRYLALFPAVAVTGPRQSGKSTLLRVHLLRIVKADIGQLRESRLGGHLSSFPT